MPDASRSYYQDMDAIENARRHLSHSNLKLAEALHFDRHFGKPLAGYSDAENQQRYDFAIFHVFALAREAGEYAAYAADALVQGSEPSMQQRLDAVDERMTQIGQKALAVERIRYIYEQAFTETSARFRAARAEIAALHAESAELERAARNVLTLDACKTRIGAEPRSDFEKVVAVAGMPRGEAIAELEKGGMPRQVAKSLTFALGAYGAAIGAEKGGKS